MWYKECTYAFKTIKNAQVRCGFTAFILARSCPCIARPDKAYVYYTTFSRGFPLLKKTADAVFGFIYGCQIHWEFSQAKYTFDQLLPCTCFYHSIQEFLYVLPIISIFGSIGNITSRAVKRSLQFFSDFLKFFPDWYVLRTMSFAFAAAVSMELFFL